MRRLITLPLALEGTLARLGPLARLVLAVLLGPLVLVVGACSQRGPAWPERPHLVLISLDAVRADHLGAYGYPRDTSPAIDAFARRGVRFEGAFSPQPWTLQAHTTMLTGLPPMVHRVDADHALSHAVPTLAEDLVRAGTHTSLAVVHELPWLHPRYGFDRGFSRYERLGGGPEEKVDAALAMVDAHPGQPLFLFVHFFAAHSDFDKLPYESELEHRRALAASPGSRFEGCLPGRGCASELLAELSRRGERLSHADEARLTGLYDAGLRTLDDAVGRLLQGLEERSVLDRGVVLLTADHGEELGDHGTYLHTGLTDEVTRVPLLVHSPSARPAVVSELVGLDQVHTALRGWAGLGPPGRVAELVDGGPSSPQAVAFFSRALGIQGLRTPTHSLWRSPAGLVLHELAVDPLQQQPVPRGRDAQTDALMDSLDARLDAEEARWRGGELLQRATPVALQEGASEAESSQLEALGYSEPVPLEPGAPQAQP